MSNCLKNMTIEEIKENFGKDDMKTCNSCPNLKYEDGMLQCTLIKK